MKHLILISLLLLSSCSTILEDRSSCPNYLCLFALEQGSVISIDGSDISIDTNAYDIPLFSDDATISIFSRLRSNSSLSDDGIIIKDLSENADSLFFYRQSYDFRHTSQIHDTIRYSPSYYSFTLTITDKADANDVVSYAIISSVGGYDRQGRAIARKHILYNKKTSVVLKPISTPILLRCIVTNQIYPTEIIEYNLSDILTKGKYNYTIELDLNTGQLIAQ